LWQYGGGSGCDVTGRYSVIPIDDRFREPHVIAAITASEVLMNAHRNLETALQDAVTHGRVRVRCPFRVVIASVLFMFSPSLHACSCASLPACVLPTDYPLVFIGRVVKKQVDIVKHLDGRPPDPVAPALVTFEVADYLRGQQGPNLDIRTTEGCCLCGYSFVVGVDYLVFASKTNGDFTTGTCTPTQPLRTASALIEQLRSAGATGSPAQIFGFVGFAPKELYQTKPLDSIPIRVVGTERTFETKTSPEGAYAFHNLPPDKYRVEAVLPSGLTTGEAEFGLASQSLELGPNTRGCQANIRVSADGRISGSVVNEKGEPRRAYVAVIPADGVPEPTTGAIVSQTTSESGQFRLPLLPAGRYFLVYSPEIGGQIAYRHRIYYRGTSVPADAKVIELQLGEHADSVRLVIPD
jgi:hypothetical protein